MLTKDEIFENISELKSFQGKWRGKYLRNLRLYCYSMGVTLDNIKDGSVIGYWKLINSDLTSTITENVIQSCIDTLVSKLAAKNAIPFFNTVNGTYEQMQVTRQIEQYFGSLYDEQNVTETVTEAFRDACIFGTGFVYIDKDKRAILRALPWQVMTRPAEDTYDKLTRIYYERKEYPVTLLNIKLPSDLNTAKYVTYGEYYDTINNTKAYLVNGTIIKVEAYTCGVIPFNKISYVNPVVGKDTTSVVDILYGIQMKLQDLYDTYSEAIKKNPAQTFVMPQGSDGKVTKLTNRIGQILTYKPIEGISNPVIPVTPDFISNQYIQAINELKDDAGELVGLSKLSREGTKPAGIDSGRGLRTLNDIESERFEVQFKAVIRLYNQIARTFIKIMNPEDLVLPEDTNRLPIKWQSVQDIYSKMKIEFSSIDFLSKDPTQRALEIDMLVQRGAIPQSKASLFYEIPDSSAAYSYANNALNAVLMIINQAITKEDYTIPSYIPLDTLMAEIVSTLLSLKAVENDINTISISRLEMLYKEALKMKEALDNQAVRNMQNADQQSFDLNLQRQATTIYKTKLAEVQAQIEAQKLLNTNNISQENV